MYFLEPMIDLRWEILNFIFNRFCRSISCCRTCCCWFFCRSGSCCAYTSRGWFSSCGHGCCFCRNRCCCAR